MSILRAKGVCKSYRRGDETITALGDIDFAIDRPEIVALSGPSGSGKSTLLNAMARFDEIDRGQILIDGEDIFGIEEAELDHFRNRKLGFIFQSFNLIKVLSATENVELSLAPHAGSKKEKRAQAHAMLQAVGLKDRLDHRPGQLSGGQQQRVAIARALVGKPRIVIADEPTGNLDSTTAHEILELMTGLNRQLGTTFVIATHDPRVMDMADRVITLKDGRIAA